MARKMASHIYARKSKKQGRVHTLYYVRFKDWKGIKRVFPAGDSYAEAWQIRHEKLELNHEKHDFDTPPAPPPAMTFAQWTDVYLEHAKSKRSWSRDKEHCEHLKKFFGALLLSDIRRLRIGEYKNLRLSEPIVRHKKQVEGTRVQISTVNRELACLRQMLNLAADEGIIESVPRIKLQSEKHLARDRALSEYEFGVLLKGRPRWFVRLCILAVETSWDRGDLLGLTVKANLDREGRMFKLKGRQKTRVGARVPILPGSRLEHVIDEILEERKKVRSAGDLLLTINGKPIKPWMVRNELDRKVGVTKLEDFRFKDLRHTAKTWWMKRGIKTEVSMAMAGHASVQSHYRYVNLNDLDIYNAVADSTNDQQSATKSATEQLG